MSKIILIGGFHEIIELAEENSIEIVGIIDNTCCKRYRTYDIICDDEHAKNLDIYYRSIPLIITPDKPVTRKKLFEFYAEQGFSFTSLISKKANISKSATINEGTVIQLGVNVSADVLIGRFVKLNTFCNIMHNSKIGDFTTIGPNAVVLGNVIIGQYCYIGSNSTVLPGISICDNVLIGAGTVVPKNILIPGTYIGNPAKPIETTNFL